MAIHEVDPISRIEGHLGVKLTTMSGVAVAADVHGNLWRGFENFLIGRQPNDAITFTQRICGVCPLPHATASMFAVESVLGYNDNFVTFGDGDGDGKGVPAKAVHIRNLVYAAEFVMSHITHFYHLAAPSYIQGPNIPPWTPFFSDNYYHLLLRNVSTVGTGDLTGGAAGRTTMPAMNATDHLSNDLWSAVIKQYVKALRIRRLTFEAGALFAGRMPMVSAFVAGGTTNGAPSDFTNRCDMFETLMKEVGNFVVKEYVPVVLALGALYPNYDNLLNAQTSNAVSGVGMSDSLWTIAGNASPPSSSNTGYGAGYGNFLSWGAFPSPASGANATLALAGGTVVASGATSWLLKGKNDATYNPAFATSEVQAKLREHIAHSRYDAYTEPDGAAGYTSTSGAAYPGAVSRTKPSRDDANKYSWLKAPRWDGHPMEVGPFARLVVNQLYPIDGSAVAAGGLAAVFAKYLKNNGSVDGLDPAMIDPDIAIALVKEGLATVNAGGATIDNTTPGYRATIVSAYGNANVCITGNVNDWIRALKGGLSTMDRLRARGIECLFLVIQMIGMFTGGAGAGALGWPTHGGWIGAVRALAGSSSYSHKATPTTLKVGMGVSEAPRGGLAHFITIDKGKIAKYQCVVPTTWNASPKDNTEANGPMEEAMMLIPFMADGGAIVNGSQTQGGVEALRVAQSFDPCIACAVH